MAGGTTGLIYRGRVTLAAGRATMIDAASAFLCPGFGMAQIERGLIPIGGVMT